MVAIESTCPICGSPFTPEPITLPFPGGVSIETRTTSCPSCSDTLRKRDEADSRAFELRMVKPLASLIPTPGGAVHVHCRVCGGAFDADSVVFKGDKRVPEKTLYPTVCDSCSAKESRPDLACIEPEERKRKRQWVQMTGTRYADFHAGQLPEIIKPIASRVLGWKPQQKGIGLVGPSRTGKSPLLFALAQNLYVEGHDVFPISGIEFQRTFLRGMEDGTKSQYKRASWGNYLERCEQCEVLLIDDADKLNLTAGVEAEYYGMLETRRNWEKPVLCTLNLSGPEFAALGRDRSDRAAAIVERLRDLCEFIQVS